MENMKKTVVIGASPDQMRYSNIACKMLTESGYQCVPLGIKKGNISGKAIQDIREKPVIDDVHTVTLYLSPKNQPHWYDYILGLNPKRIIFNPGTENIEFAEMAKTRGIDTEFACNLVLLSTGQF